MSANNNRSNKRKISNDDSSNVPPSSKRRKLNSQPVVHQNGTVMFFDIAPEIAMAQIDDMQIPIHKKTGRLNVSKIARLKGKKLSQWLLNDHTKEFLTAYAKSENKPFDDWYFEISGGQNAIRGIFFFSRRGLEF